MDASATRRSPTALGAVLAVIGVLAALAAGAAYAGRLDSTPPTLTWVDLDVSTPVGGEIALSVAVRDARPGLGSLALVVDRGEPVPFPPPDPTAAPAAPDAPDAAPRRTVRLDTAPLSDGPHAVEVVAVDRSWLRNETRLATTLEVDHTPPALSIAGSSLSAPQGSTLAIWIRASEPLAGGTVTVGEEALPLYTVGPPAGDDRPLYRALAGIGTQMEPDAHLMTVEATDLAGNAATGRVGLRVTEVAWPFGGYVKLTADQQRAQKDETRGQEANRRRGEAYVYDEPAQLWSGVFDRPAEGRVTSPFGKERTYSSGIRRHHLGIDIANAEGTPIRAPADGVVTLASELHIYGNAVILSHGQGVSTSYNHLSAIDVEVGQRVRRGDVVGHMGSTGQSTGSHLHWGMVVGGVAVDPGQWTEQAFVPDDFDEFRALP